ncbi:DUF5058 family protein [Paeniglutamicibacter kerguelensis]|uniref:DUF5058 family protein n=1 Tax=Paeniglutamicibacter kerguelensis TaxID=254788 RepID=A0ABS4XG18_9MICC|nr:DUF5058 family protein [Paeniglutamicibacter kerguelensis]MBP2387251.1 hypothetical protein [Paeniglutamicibacter kerguelensis]
MHTLRVPIPAAAGSTDILAVANSPLVWICALGVFAVIFIQTFIYVKAARRTAPEIGMPASELTGAFRAGAVASIGPSLAVVLVAIALLALFGTPAVLVRIGLIGSAATETASAGIAATSMGATLGGADYTQQVFAVAFMAMSLSGGMWMLATLLLTPILKRGGKRLAQVNPAAMAIIPAAALLGAFSMLSIAEMPKSGIHFITLLVSAAVMAGCLFLAKILRANWLKEWALGFAIIVAIAVAFVAHTS